MIILLATYRYLGENVENEGEDSQVCLDPVASKPLLGVFWQGIDLKNYTIFTVQFMGISLTSCCRIIIKNRAHAEVTNLTQFTVLVS